MLISLDVARYSKPSWTEKQGNASCRQSSVSQEDENGYGRAAAPLCSVRSIVRIDHAEDDWSVTKLNVVTE